METLELIQMLYHHEAGLRRQAALVIGMVEETSALAALEQRLREEPDENIVKVIMWSGKRVKQAHQRGFSTVDAIFDYFQINRELASGIDPEEAELLRHQTRVQPRTQSGGVLSDIRLGSTLTADDIKTGRLGRRDTNKKALLRSAPIQPTTTDISLKIKRLLDSSDAQRQKNAAIELRDISNPQALPYLALVFYRNENPENSRVIEQAGKVLYWNHNYAAMDKNGRIKLEIAKRRREGVYPKQAKATSEPSKPGIRQESVTDILNQAQLRRKKKRRR